MVRRLALICAFGGMVASGVLAQGRPTIVVKEFKVAAGASWPYDMDKMTAQLRAEMHNEDGKKFSVVAETTDSGKQIYTLEGEVME